MKDRYITNQNISSCKGRTIKNIYSGSIYRVLKVEHTLLKVIRGDTVAAEYFTKNYVKDNFILLGGC